MSNRLLKSEWEPLQNLGNFGIRAHLVKASWLCSGPAKTERRSEATSEFRLRVLDVWMAIWLGQNQAITSASSTAAVA
jgi:hypothetical protein